MLWENGGTSNFAFSHSVFYPFEELSAIFIKFEIVVCKLFQFATLKLVILEKVNCTTQSQVLLTITKKTFENRVVKGENTGNQYFLLFPLFSLP